MPMKTLCTQALLLAAATLAGCGAEVAGTAAIVGNLAATQAQQARAQQAQVVDGFKSAQQAGAARAASAAD
jgi:outer membrane lipopolysaccharide assembly protein LptE/RlpB